MIGQFENRKNGTGPAEGVHELKLIGCWWLVATSQQRITPAAGREWTRLE
jgi:hypothetical protein